PCDGPDLGGAGQGVRPMTWMSGAPGALGWHPGPGAEELVRRRAQLQVLSRRLLERERELAAFHNELHAFETTYRKALGSRYARLDELADRLGGDAAPADPGAGGRSGGGGSASGTRSGSGGRWSARTPSGCSASWPASSIPTWPP